MGLTISVYRNAEFGDCSNNGITARFKQLCLVNASGPVEPSADCPAVVMEQHVSGCLRIVEAVQTPAGKWIGVKDWVMNGGNYAATSDSRFGELAERLLGHRFYGAVAVHDRREGNDYTRSMD